MWYVLMLRLITFMGVPNNPSEIPESVDGVQDPNEEVESADDGRDQNKDPALVD